MVVGGPGFPLFFSLYRARGFTIFSVPHDSAGAPFLLRSRFWFWLRSNGGIPYRILFALAHAIQVSGPDLGRAVRPPKNNTLCAAGRRGAQCAERPKKTSVAARA